MNLELTFTFDEMKRFLEQHDFIVISVVVKQIRTIYHNNYDNITFTKEIAFKADEGCFLNSETYDYDEVKDFYIEDIFKYVMKKSLLKLN